VEILNLGGASDNNSSAPKAGKKLRVLFGIGALAAVTGIGSTLAANITLNTDDAVEFGQGVVTTAACDGDITIAPSSIFVNPSPAPSGSPATTARFDLGTIALSDVDTSTLAGGDTTTEGCDGTTLTIKAYGDSGDTALALETTSEDIDGTPTPVYLREIRVNVTAASPYFALAGSNGGVAITNITSSSFDLELDEDNSPITADEVYKITVESTETL
jgi:hypothetical protein